MVSAVELIQDVQLVCYAVIFTFMALGNRSDRTLRLIWWGFLVDGGAGIIDLLSSHLPRWIGYGFNYESSPVSYGLLNLAIATFIGRERWTRWISVALVLGGLPFYLAWSGRANQIPSIAVIDVVLFIQTACTAWVLLRTRERATQMSRINMSVFLAIYAAVELYRVIVATVLHADPSTYSSRMEFVTSGVYVVSGSVLPLAIIWMMNSRMQHHLTVQTHIDPLTEVLNRRGLNEAAQREMARYLRGRQDFAVAVADIDHFKLLNDTYGHACGDDVLRATAKLLRNTMRESDVVSRSGGEEFVILLPLTPENEAFAVMERARSGLARLQLLVGEENAQVTISIGITNTRGRRILTWAQLSDEADRALYAAKRNGRNQTMRYSGLAKAASSTDTEEPDQSDEGMDALPTA
jgi:diguanylate cyclase (GGDEF)-like protein